MNNSRFKFRAWDLLNHRMWPVVSPDFILKRCIIGVSPEWQENAIYEMRLEDLIIQQYTGLKDKNGKEIYEGDIIRWFSRIVNSSEEIECFGGVEFAGGEFFAEEKEKRIVGRYIRGASLRFFEVIGNIYENPELLEANNE